ncbi:hypothetical protein SDC9_83240 [bioreactor metagenome]|uniref:Uncharacterized protein n=1 Tax=bioreactor metagenome TaxID=1076179 RepID=A0A644Z9H6_9ZZZZ
MATGVDFSHAGTEALYRERDGKLLIELELHSLMQIFNSFDPAPFHEKELDEDAEVYIYNIVGEFPLKKPLEIVIYVPSAEFSRETEHTLKEAIKNHFLYKKVLSDIDLRRLLQRGGRNMEIAVIFLFICLLIIRLLSTLESGLLKTTLSEGLTIIGWVAMWEPVNVFLYGWWPIVKKRNIYGKIVNMEVCVRTGSTENEKSSYCHLTSGTKP